MNYRLYVKTILILLFTSISILSSLSLQSLAYAAAQGNCPNITVVPNMLPDATTGVAYNQTITAVGGVGPYSFKLLTGNSLPPGLKLSSSGDLTGTPTQAGIFNFGILATDKNNCQGNVTY